MRRCFRLLPIVILLAGCGGAAPAGQAENPAPPPTTEQPPAARQLPLGDLLFQPGDLPGVVPGSLHFFDPATVQAARMAAAQPGEVARLSLLIPGTPFVGHVTAYAYRSGDERSQQFAAMLRARNDIGPDDQGIIRSVAAESYTYASIHGAQRLVIGHCGMIVDSFLDAPFTRADASAYGERIARRIQAVDCDGSPTVPILPTPTAAPTAMPPAATPTPAPPATPAPLGSFAVSVRTLS
ncbi:MAG TPA: hypothetical protein VD886_21725, partial [Herpetosiphonaceae bacterium]|nr:hypothetical protein [Herpetosiphonaceae bacterium]